jgi:hypothetical protein
MGIFTNMEWAYNGIKFLADPSSVPLVGTPYSKLYVVNSYEMLDIAAKDIISSNKDGAYFISLDLPADMLVYDENCHLKPSTEWISMKGLPWVKEQNQLKKMEAYADQTLCLYGKLQSFVNHLKSENLEKNTVLVIQGVSGAEGIKPINSASFVNSFRDRKLVDVAIKDPYATEFNIKYNICSPSSLIRQYLFKKPTCEELNGLPVNDGAKFEIRESIQEYPVKPEDSSKARDDFNNWYKEWLEKNPVSYSYIEDTASPTPAVIEKPQEPIVTVVEEPPMEEIKVFEPEQPEAPQTDAIPQVADIIEEVPNTNTEQAPESASKENVE